MPELPEVETIARSLRQSGRGEPGIVGMHIRQAVVLWNRSIQTPSCEEFINQIAGQEIEEISRRGKYLVMRLSKDYLLIHLRMSGDLRVEPAQETAGQMAVPRKHDRVILFFEEGYSLSFEDARKFGRMWLVNDPGAVLSSLGPEPFDANLSDEIFFHRLQSSRSQLKPLLLNQTFLAGVGNIYADEALFQAHLHPMTTASSLDEEQARQLLFSIRDVLQTGIEKNGASIDWAYKGGNFQNTFQVYGRENEPCYRCGHIIEKIIVHQRGTHFCPFCQLLNPTPEKTVKYS